MSTTTSARLTWGGTAEVVPYSGNVALGTATGAYIAVVGVAASAEAFRAGVKRAMGALEFELIDLEEVRQLRSPSDIVGFEDIMRDRMALLSEENPIEFGSFHSYSD